MGWLERKGTWAPRLHAKIIDCWCLPRQEKTNCMVTAIWSRIHSQTFAPKKWKPRFTQKTMPRARCVGTRL
jgi:hypothetical protein